MTKKYILFIGLVSSFITSCSQTEKPNVVFDRYIKATHSDDVTEQINYLHPELFTYYPKDSLIKSYQMLKNYEGVSLGDEEIISTSETFNENGVDYASIKFSQKMSLDISNVKDQGGSALAIALMLEEFNSKYGAENVAFDTTNFIIDITTINEVYMINDPQYENWKIFVKDSTINYNAVIPEIIQEKLKPNL